MRHNFRSRPLYPQYEPAPPAFSVLILAALVLLSVFSYIGAYAQDIAAGAPAVRAFHAISSHW
jgi:hypothetical protein